MNQPLRYIALVLAICALLGHDIPGLLFGIFLYLWATTVRRAP